MKTIVRLYLGLGVAGGLLLLSALPSGAARAQALQQAQNRIVTRTQDAAPASLNLAADTLTLDVPVVAVLQDGTNEVPGITLQPVSDSLRAQLALPAGRGVLVTALAGDGPAAQAGLKENDILVGVHDNPLASADDLVKELKAAGESPVRLRIIRGGKPSTLDVHPIYRVTIGPASAKEAEWYIGIGVNPADDTLRAHVDLPDGRGLVVTQVVPGSPAEKAGVKLFDILLEMNNQPLESPESLKSQVQTAANKAATLKLLRSGETLTLSVTPERRKEEPRPHHDNFYLWTVPHGGPYGVHPGMPGPHAPYWSFKPFVAPAPADAGIDKRLDAIDRELKALREAVEEIRDALKAAKAKPDR
jgi:C-terminal processing protease CtpA/Prc